MKVGKQSTSSEPENGAPSSSGIQPGEERSPSNSRGTPSISGTDTSSDAALQLTPSPHSSENADGSAHQSNVLAQHESHPSDLDDLLPLIASLFGDDDSGDRNDDNASGPVSQSPVEMTSQSSEEQDEDLFYLAPTDQDVDAGEEDEDEQQQHQEQEQEEEEEEEIATSPITDHSSRSVAEAANPDEPTDDAASNPSLTELFFHLNVFDTQPSDQYRMNAFQHAVTHIAFETINDSREEPLDSFGPYVPHLSHDIITRIIDRVTARYAVKLWPNMDVIPLWLLVALGDYVWALTKIRALRENSGEDTLQVLDNILGMGQDEGSGSAIEGNDGSPTGTEVPADAAVTPNGSLRVETADETSNQGSAGGHFECYMRVSDSFERCSEPFATAVDLERHPIEMHELDPEAARDAVQDLVTAFKRSSR